MKKTTNYLANRSLMKFIHDSKATFTWYMDGDYKTTKYKDYDLIVCDKEVYDHAYSQMLQQRINRKRFAAGLERTSVVKEDDIEEMISDEDIKEIEDKIIIFKGEFTPEIISKAKLGKKNRELYENKKNRLSEITPEIEAEYSDEDIVVRVLTFDHIPKDDSKKKYRKAGDDRVKTNFPPYKHYAIVDGVLTCVALSHHDRDKKFSLTSGKINDDLGHAIMLIGARIANKHNYRNYSYLDEMKANSNAQLVAVCLQYNEFYGENPFAYYTTTVNNSFKQILTEEKDTQEFRDKQLMEANYNPSMTAQINQELSREEHWNEILDTGHDGEVVDIDVDDYDNGEDSITGFEDEEIHIDTSDPTFDTEPSFDDDDEY